MKYFCSVVILTFAFLVSGICQVKKDKSNKVSAASNVAEKCSVNSDSLYDREKVLKQLAEILNNTATYFHNAKYLNKNRVSIASVENGRPIGFTVYDLTGESNIGTPLGSCMEFKDSHIYHFSLIFTSYSFSHIAILEGGKLKTFKGINCQKGDSLGDVVNYLDQKLKDDSNKDEIISRLKNYRKYGIYAATDDSALQCQEVGGDKNKAVLRKSLLRQSRP
jgi:hypothetical protein